MRTLVAVWALVAALFVVYYLRRPQARSGLVLAYIIVLFINYWLGAAVYLLPRFVVVRDPELTRLGFEQSLNGLIAFVVGCIVAVSVLGGRQTGSPPSEYRPSSGVARWYLVIGAVSYAALLTVLQSIPSATSLAGVGQQLFVVGVCLLARDAWYAGERVRFLRMLATACLLPFVTILAGGFIGYGTVAMVAVMAFVGAFVRRKTVVVAAGLVLAFLSLSLYVTYLRDRPKIREVVWGGAAPQARVNQLGKTLSKFEFFSTSNPRHLDAIDDRLNLDYLTGVAIRRVEVTRQFANGSTITQAAAAILPRILWPSKQEAGGSGLVTRFTGITFYGNTSVGMGLVMEFYVNAGRIGVLVGFFVLGVVMTVLDRRAALLLRMNDHAGFATSFVIGLGLLQVGSSLAEAVGTTAASVVLMLILNRSFIGRSARHPAKVLPSRPALRVT